MEQKRASWSGQLAFILAAAASAIGLGNLWRFPYLAAQYGGGTFILVYLCLVVTLGFTLMLTEIAIGRKAQQSQLTAYSRLHRGWGFLGLLGTIIPLLIVPYYCVIGGWVLKYLVAYGRMCLNPGANLMADPTAFFNGFISASEGFAAWGPFIYGAVFVVLTAGVILLGVKNGIEKSNFVMMPLLFVMALAIAGYVIYLPGSGAGLKYYLVPNLDGLRDTAGNFSFAILGKTVLGAMGQMFYSLSLAMGIMITYGSYMRKQDAIEKSVRRIEVCDTLIAVIAGLMIIPVVYMFAVKEPQPVPAGELVDAGCDAALVQRVAVDAVRAKNFTDKELERFKKDGVTAEAARAKAVAEWRTQPVALKDFTAAKPSDADGKKAADLSIKKAMKGGPGLMFMSLPKVFSSLGTVGNWIGFTFFLLVTFAALTSAISLMEACVAAFCDLFKMKRAASTVLTFFIMMVLAFLSATGYGLLGSVKVMGMEFLDFFDFITNSALMPIVAALTCIFVGWVLKPKSIIDEVSAEGHDFKASGLYTVMVKWFAPLLVIAILVSEICRAFKIGGWSI